MKVKSGARTSKIIKDVKEKLWFHQMN
jgi:hypothetical protein